MRVYLTFGIKAFERNWTLTIPNKTDEDGDGFVVDDLDDGWLEGNEGVLVGLSVESMEYTLEGSEDADAVGRVVVDAVGRAVVDVFSWHFPLVIKTSSMAMWLARDPAIPSNVTWMNYTGIKIYFHSRDANKGGWSGEIQS